MMTPELSAAVASATVIRHQIDSRVCASLTPAEQQLRLAVDLFLIKAFTTPSTLTPPPLKNRSGPPLFL